MDKTKGKADLVGKNRMVFFTGDFETELTTECVKKIIEYELDDPHKDILLYIDSFGGECYSFFALHDAMNLVRCDVATIVAGKAMSAGILALISGENGKRFATPNSTLLIHQVSSDMWGSASELEDHLGETKRLQKAIEDLLVKRTKLDRKALKRLMSRQSYFSAKEALEYGVVDHIVTNPKVLWGNVNI